MLLCVAGGGSSGFNRDRSREGARCSAQSTLLKNNAEKQIMVNERCPMTSATVNVSSGLSATQDPTSLDPRSSRSAHNKHNETNLTHRAKVIVVRGDVTVSESVNKSETCTTTTTFKSSIVNGKRSTNTILVRYKPSSYSSEEDFKNDYGSQFDSSQHNASVSSSSSTASNDSASSKKDKASISAWAQIMELEGYRSPAIGLDKAPKNSYKSTDEDDVDDESIDSSICGLNDSAYCPPKDKSNRCSAEVNIPGKSYCYFQSHDISPNFKTSCTVGANLDSIDYSSSRSVALQRPVSVLTVNGEIYRPSSQINIHFPKSEKFEKTITGRSKYASASLTVSSDTISDDSLAAPLISPNEKTCIKIAHKVKSPMYRSESSRVPKVVNHEKNKSRRKTLPDGNLQLDDNAQTYKYSHNKQINTEIDPNASWGRYNSKAMRDSVRKVAQKYAEVYLRRQSRSKLDALPEINGVKLTKYASPYSNQDHVHSSSKFHSNQGNLYSFKAPSVPSHLHKVALDPEIMLSNHRKFHFKPPTSTHHDHSMQLTGINCAHKSREAIIPGLFETDSKLRCSALLNEKQYFESESVSSNSDRCSSESSQVNVGSSESESSYCDNCDVCKLKNDYPMCKNYSKCYCNCSNSYRPLKCSSFPAGRDSYIRTTGDYGNSCHCIDIHDVRSKLCEECAQFGESGPPNKQPASRSKSHRINVSFPSSPNLCSSVSNLKIPPNGVNGPDSSLHSHSYSSNKDSYPSKINSTSKCYKKLTVREMTELVHGGNSGMLSEKVPPVGVTSKVTSWIQKQKEKRKLVFFIGDAPSFVSGKQGDILQKYTNRKSKRSLSLSSVRDDDVSINYKGLAESASDVSVVHLNPSTDDKEHSHKNLYVKRASSSCSNRGSVRRKIRQGPPIREEKKSVAKNFHNRMNQVDGCITSWNDRTIALELQNNHSRNTPNLKHKINKNDSFSERDIALNNTNCSTEVHDSSESQYLSNNSKDTTTASDISNNEESKGHKVRPSYRTLLCDDNNDKIPLDTSGQNLQSLRSTKNERSSFSKRLLNIKQLTRALSLHSLKKKTKESIIEESANKSKTEVSSFSHQSSKFKYDDNKYGSLRKSISYCELAVREANISQKSKSPVTSHTEIKCASKPSVRASAHLTNSICCCSVTLKRSVSLYLKFPLSRCLEYLIEDPKSDFLARLCVSRLYSHNGIPPFLRQLHNKPNLDEMKDNGGSQTTFKKQLLDIPKREIAEQTPVIILVRIIF